MLNENQWTYFPKNVALKINYLLDGAQPNPAKCFQLYKTCQREGLWHDSFEQFSVQLKGYFLLPNKDKVKSYLDLQFSKPMDKKTFDEFSLTFRTAHIKAAEILDLANWIHDMFEKNLDSDKLVTSTEVFNDTLKYITNPPRHEKEVDIDFEDFCIAWKKTVFNNYGHTYDADMSEILGELRKLNRDLKIAENNRIKNEGYKPTVYLTQTEITWTEQVLKAAFNRIEVPEYPLKRGPEKLVLIELQKAALLLNAISKTNRIEFKNHQEIVRTTVIYKAGWLLKECYR
jgi:hypothetical protein